jgi:hypothetical protein
MIVVSVCGVSRTAGQARQLIDTRKSRVRITPGRPGSKGARNAGSQVQHHEASRVTKPAVPSESSVKAAASLAEPEGEPLAAAAAAAGGSSPWSRRRFKRRLLVPLLGLLVIVGVVGALVLPQFFASNPTQTVWQSITSGMTDGTVPKQVALEAFAYVYKVNIPGVTVPSGLDGGDVPTSGTGAMDWVQANWSQLTPDQQAVIDTYTTPGPGDQTIPISPAPSSATSGSVAKPLFQLMAARNTGPANVQLAPKGPLTLAQAMSNELYADIARIGPKLGMPVLSPGSVFSPNISLDLSMSLKDGGNALMTTNAEVSAKLKLYTPCHVTVWKNGWENENVTSSGGVSPTLHVLLTHEVVHCYQDVVWGSNLVKNNIPAWIKEGTAMWLAADDTGIAEPFMTGMWNDYFFSQVSLTKRTYDAYGYFALLAHNGRDLWSLMLPAWQAAAAAASSYPSTAFIAVLQGDAADIRNSWAESYLRQTDWGDPWIAYGFGLPDAAEVNQHPAQAQPDPGWMGSLNGRSNIVLNVNATSGEVVTVTTDGLASVHDNSGNSDVAFGSERFCTVSGGCVCPQGTMEAGTNVAPKQMTIPFVAAFNAPSAGSHYSVVSDKLDDLCKRPPTPEPTQYGNPCGPNCSNSHGDPHLLTVNAYRYDFQAAGEFTLLRSADGSLEIQARQEPLGSKRIALNTAVAARVGSHRVAVYAGGGSLQARVDGTPVDLKSPMDLGNGGRISTYNTDLPGFEIDFPDGTRMWTIGAAAMNVEISPSVPLQTSGVGLLSRVVPGGLGVPALPDGTRLPAATDKQAQHDVLYGKYADAWRVTNSTTLFDYDAGKSTATYTIEGFPAYADYITAGDLTAAQTATGTPACTAITDAGLHSDCVFDVGVTGDSTFAQTYQATQSFFDSGIARATPAPQATPAPTPVASGAVIGALQIVQGSRLGGFALGPDNMLYIAVEVSSGHSILVEVDPTTGKIVHQVDVPALTDVHVVGGSVWLPGLVTDSNGDRCSVTRFDASTLTQGATIALPCSPQTPQIASDGSAIWFVDTTKYDVPSKKGAVLTRIDPATNGLGPSVALPSDSGRLEDSQGAVFFLDTGLDRGSYRLTSGAPAMDSLGVFNVQTVVAAGTGLWVTSADGQAAEYFTAAGTPQVTLPMSAGKLVAGDATAAYLDILGQDSTGGRTSDNLWRYPIDGSAPTMLASAPIVDGEGYSYSSAYQPPPVANGHGIALLMSVNVSGAKTPWVILQWAPLK